MAEGLPDPVGHLLTHLEVGFRLDRNLHSLIGTRIPRLVACPNPSGKDTEVSQFDAVPLGQLLYDFVQELLHDGLCHDLSATTT